VRAGEYGGIRTCLKHGASLGAGRAFPAVSCEPRSLRPTADVRCWRRMSSSGLTWPRWREGVNRPRAADVRLWRVWSGHE
jgi:hypothetical protein